MGTGADRAIKLYVRALDMSGVALAADSDEGRVIVLTGGEPSARVRRLGENVNIVRLLWCVSPSQAELLAEHVRQDLALVARPERGGWYGVDPDLAAESLARAVYVLGINCESNENVECAAAEAVAMIDKKIADLQRSGGMKSFNKAYREYRLRAKAEGRGAMQYAGYLENYRLDLIKVVAQTARTLDRHAFANLPATE